MSDGALDELAAWLVVPVKSGLCLSKQDLIALARATDGSLRVNERKRMLADVLKSAQTPEALRQLLERVVDRCRVELGDYQDLAKVYPVMGALVKPWVERLEASVKALEETKEDISFAEGAS